MLIACKGLMFDMDGVLISSIASVNRCWRRWAAHHGVEDAEQITIAHGTRAQDILRSLRPHFTESQIEEGLKLIEDMEIEDVADLQVLPGVRQLLESLPADRWTIVTSATRRLMLGRLAAARLPCPAQLIAGDDVVNGKPHPEPYSKGASLLGLRPEECVVIEDAPSGVGSGKAAGSRVLGVLGTHDSAQLYQAGAEFVVTALTGVHAHAEGDLLHLQFQALPRQNGLACERATSV